MSDMRQPHASYEVDGLTIEIYDAVAASIIPGSSIEGTSTSTSAWRARQADRFWRWAAALGVWREVNGEASAGIGR